MQLVFLVGTEPTPKKYTDIGTLELDLGQQTVDAASGARPAEHTRCLAAASASLGNPAPWIGCHWVLWGLHCFC